MRLKAFARSLAALTLFAVSSCQSPVRGPANVGALNSPVNTAAQNTPLKPVKLGSNFMWGVSSAGYQAEGNEHDSQWAAWERAGKTKHISGKAVDFYNRYEEDILLAKAMGVNTFRLSIEWSRIEPKQGVIDQTQLNFYKNLVKTVRKHGMEPLVTLVHFTYPHWLDTDSDRDGLSGWEDPDTVEHYLNYTALIGREFSADVRYWITFNEPNIWIPLAHLAGKMPPGGKNIFGLLRAGRNMLQAHARAYDRLHAIRPDAMVSSNIFQFQYNPFARSARSFAASNTALSENTVREFAESDWFMEALETGEYAYEPHLQALFKPSHFKGGVSAMNNGVYNLLGRFDYVSFDYYYRFTKLSQVLNAADVWDMPIYPEGLYNVLMSYQRRFRKPIVIAEHGIGTFNGQPRADGWKRSDNLVQTVHHMQRAMNDGANVIGYCHWSITDNYEWGNFDARFGLYRVEALTDGALTRIPTDGVEAYKAVIAASGVNQILMQQFPGPVRR